MAVFVIVSMVIVDVAMVVVVIMVVAMIIVVAVIMVGVVMVTMVVVAMTVTVVMVMAVAVVMIVIVIMIVDVVVTVSVAMVMIVAMGRVLMAVAPHRRVEIVGPVLARARRRHVYDGAQVAGRGLARRDGRRSVVSPLDGRERVGLVVGEVVQGVRRRRRGPVAVVALAPTVMSSLPVARR